MQIRHQRADSGKTLALASFEFGDGLASGGVWNFDFEGQAALVSNAQHQETDGVGDGQAHRFQRVRSPLLGLRINTGTNIGVGGGQGDLFFEIRSGLIVVTMGPQRKRANYLDSSRDSTLLSDCRVADKAGTPVPHFGASMPTPLRSF